ncbi:hypothetical protein NDU88_002633 [Pleurodeles waltl]|uniref:Uncharacterized protein n=1 Tax=Pleurodeles waltl TaxID=8319 RepID=A0AAV7UC38_PLEWA|nr:hypothetical protein NDU88_002633 [Pleurodeles waltl]
MTGLSPQLAGFRVNFDQWACRFSSWRGNVPRWAWPIPGRALPFTPSCCVCGLMGVACRCVGVASAAPRSPTSPHSVPTRVLRGRWCLRELWGASLGTRGETAAVLVLH